MYNIMVDFLLIGLIAAFAALLFVGSIIVVLLDAGSQALGRAAKKYAPALARLAWPAPRPQLEAQRTAARARLHL